MTQPDASPFYTPNGSSGGGGGPSKGWIVVANEAAASAVAGLTDGQPIFILSHRSLWISEPFSTHALVPHERIARAGGGSLARDLNYNDLQWLQGNTHVYVDPNNKTGVASDENVAFFDAAQVGNARLPLLTWKEFYRRVGHGNTIDAGFDPVLGFNNLTLHAISKEPAASIGNDPMSLDFVFGVDSFGSLIGEDATVLLAGNLDNPGGFTAQNPAVPAPGGAACQIKVGATVWGPYLGKRIRFTATGAVATILKDLGGGVARISQPQDTGFAIFAASPTNVNPAQGAAFVVEDLADINVGYHWHLGCLGSPAFAFAGQLQPLDLNIALSNPGGDFPFEPVVEDGCFLIWYQCTFDRAVSQDSFHILNGCTTRAPFVGTGPGSGSMYGGAGYLGPAASPIGAEVFGSGAIFNAGVIDFFTYFQGGAVIMRESPVCAAFSIWDARVVGFFNPLGHALFVGGYVNLTAGACAASLRSATPIWGSGSPGKGVRVQAGSKIASYQTLPNITGALGDLQLGDSGVGWAWNPATGVYNPVGAGIVLTWAAIAAALGVGGFGGSAHEPAQDAHVNKGAAS